MQSSISFSGRCFAPSRSSTKATRSFLCPLRAHRTFLNSRTTSVQSPAVASEVSHSQPDCCDEPKQHIHQIDPNGTLHSVLAMLLRSRMRRNVDLAEETEESSPEDAIRRGSASISESDCHSTRARLQVQHRRPRVSGENDTYKRIQSHGNMKWWKSIAYVAA